MKARRFARISAFILAAALILPVSSAALADSEGSVAYKGGETFVYSLDALNGHDTLFNFDNVMPGDTRTAKVSIQNGYGRAVRVFLRGEPHTGENDALAESVTGLLASLSFEIKETSTSTVVQAHHGDETWPVSGDKTKYYYLGSVASGASVELNVEMNVPVTLENIYQEAWGEIEWTILVEYDTTPPRTHEPYDPVVTPYPTSIPLGTPIISVDDIPLGTPTTGDDESVLPLIGGCFGAVAAVLFATVYIVKRRKNGGKQN